MRTPVPPRQARECHPTRRDEPNMAFFELDGIKVKTPANGRYWVAPNATVLGRVEIGEDASIWFNCVARGDNEPITIGRRTNIQEGTVMHTDPGFPLIIGDGVTIGHMSMLHGCKIGNGALIGIGAILLNGAEVGEDCLVAAHALVPEGKKFPPRSLVMGSPGKVVREITDAELERMRSGVDVYVNRWQRFVKGLKPQT
jgi:carbonic anhydrase/acetyltransferase-like protein (isoleucine patch superfamily)